MSYLTTIFLGALQGVTEFFPISSSGHLLLAEHFLGLPVESFKAFDVVLHAGTLLALLFLFWREWWGMGVASCELIVGRLSHAGRKNLKLLKQLIIATIPAALVGLLLNDWIDEVTRGEGRTLLVTSFFVLVAGLLVLAERKSPSRTLNPPNPPSSLDFARDRQGEVDSGEKNLKWKQVITMGVAQMFALLPGVSRSGVTIASGMLSGLSRPTAAKFSFLMLAPVTAGAVILIAKKVFSGELTLPATEFVVVGFISSAIVSYLAALALLKFVKKHSLKIFAIYLILAAGVLLFLN